MVFVEPQVTNLVEKQTESKTSLFVMFLVTLGMSCVVIIKCISENHIAFIVTPGSLRLHDPERV